MLPKLISPIYRTITTGGSPADPRNAERRSIAETLRDSILSVLKTLFPESEELHEAFNGDGVTVIIPRDIDRESARARIQTGKNPAPFTDGLVRQEALNLYRQTVKDYFHRTLAVHPSAMRTRFEKTAGKSVEWDTVEFADENGNTVTVSDAFVLTIGLKNG